MSADFSGWTVAEALARSISPGGLSISLKEGKLVGVAPPLRASEKQIAIRAECWNDFSLKDRVRSTYIESGGSKYLLDDVRIFPVLHSPDVEDRLADRGLANVIKQNVFSDPEITCLSTRMSAANPSIEEILQSGLPSYGLDFNWPLDLTSSELANHFTRPLLLVVGPGVQDPEPSIEIQNVSNVIVDRWQTLRHLLISGRLVATGTSVATSNFGPINRRQWARAGLWLDVQNGDLLEEVRGRSEIRWSGLELTRPSAMFDVKPLTNHEVPSTTITPHKETLTKTGKALSQVKTSATSHRECLEWLVELMLKSPNERTFSRERLWEMAEDKWPGTLSERSFLAARDAAIRNTGASAWAASGAPKKSAR